MMQGKKYVFTGILVVAFMLFSTIGVHAALVTGDFREELSLPVVRPAVRVLERLAAAIAGAPDLTDSDEIANPSGYSGHADVDLSTTGLLTLTGREPDGFADYDLAVFTISNVVFDAGESIVGVTVLDGTGIFDGQNGSGFPAPVIGFSGNSVTITYTDFSGGFNFGEGQTATFQLEFAQNVPEPTTWLLFGTGLIACFALQRRQVRASLQSRGLL